jgi:hypothetical protein
MDFTLRAFKSLLTVLRDHGYLCLTVGEAAKDAERGRSPHIILRHDVDKKPESSLITAHIESDLNIQGTYYFRICPSGYNEAIIREIASMGHEIGYHYEDLDLAWRKAKGKRRKEKEKGATGRGNADENLVSAAYESFKNNLAKLRESVHVDTICMHGSPMSRYDSRLMWRYYDYGELSVFAEPYFDLSFDDMLYLTDTGRRWDGSSVSLRDRTFSKDAGYYSDWKRKPLRGSAMLMTAKGDDLQKRYRFKKTEDILRSLRAGSLPERMMMTFHPQRWSDRYIDWATELVVQNVKNQVKYLLNRRNIG